MTRNVVTPVSGWQPVGEIPPGQLSDFRLQLHHATQVAVSAAISYIPARSDDSHTSLSWVKTLDALATEVVRGTRTFRVALRPSRFALYIIDESDRPLSSFPLAGRTMSDAHAWLAEQCRKSGLDGERFTTKKHYEIPAHAVAAGAPFAAVAGEALAELERYWRNSESLLRSVVMSTEGASPIRVWPHHFDMATLIALGAGGSASARTISVGLSPGDMWYDEPYYYVGPYPFPDISALPPLDGDGHWHTESWVGAVLRASAFVSRPSGEEQSRQVVEFTRSAVAACRSLLGA